MLYFACTHIFHAILLFYMHFCLLHPLIIYWYLMWVRILFCPQVHIGQQKERLVCKIFSQQFLDYYKRLGDEKKILSTEVKTMIFFFSFLIKTYKCFCVQKMCTFVCECVSVFVFGLILFFFSEILYWISNINN